MATDTKKTTKSSSKGSTKTDKLAVIKTGGKQYLVEEGQTIKIEKLPAKSVDSKGGVKFENVLMIVDGDKMSLGTPEVKATVTGSVVEEGRAKKVEVIRYRSKSRYFKNKGHRQAFVKVKIEKIS